MFETLAFGYGLLEGPRVDAHDNLYFSDVTNGGVYCRAPNGGVTTVVPRRRGVGGIALHATGGLVISGKNVCHVRNGETRILFQQADVPGFNDLFTDAQGRVLVGSLRSDPFKLAAQVPGELWRLDAADEAVELYGGVGIANGIGFSPDGRRLYHSDSAPRHVILHDVADDGTMTNRRILVTLPDRGVPDGLAVDDDGCVWVAVYDGGCVLRYTPQGRLDRRLDVSAKAVTSLCFGGADRRDLYVMTADNTDDPGRKGSIFGCRVDVPGLPVTPASI